jgi:hypothetical protein
MARKWVIFSCRNIVSPPDGPVFPGTRMEAGDDVVQTRSRQIGKQT